MIFFNSPIFTEGVLPFLLVFTLVFAILQKTKLLGEGKNQIDALIALAVALILIVTPTPRQYIVDMIPWLAVALAVLLIFLLVYGFVASGKEGLSIPAWVKNAVLWLGIIFVVILVLNITGYIDTITGWFDGTDDLWANVIILVIIGFAIFFALGGKMGGDKGSSKSSSG